MPELFIGSNGLSLWTSRDLGATLNRMSTAAGMYSGSQVWSLSAHPLKPGRVFIGAETGVYAYDRAAGTCRHIASPMDGKLVTALAHSPANPDIVFAGTQPAGLYRSADGGITWKKLEARMKAHVSSGFPGADMYGTAPEPEGVVVRHWTRVTCIAIDPEDERRMWAGVEIDGVWRSNDGGEHWEKSSAGMVTEDIHGFALVRKSPAADAILFAVTNKGMHVSDDLGTSWRMQRIDSAWQYVRSIVVREDHNGVMFMTNGDGPPGTSGHLFRSRDWGRNWEKVPLPAQIDSSVYWAAVNRADPALIFVATNLGQLFCSSDGGESWTALKRRLGEIRALIWLPD